MKKKRDYYLNHVSSDGQKEAAKFALKVLSWSCITIFSAYKAMQAQRIFGTIQLGTMIEYVYGREKVEEIAEEMNEKLSKEL